MATASWANFWDMTSDAAFRVIGSNISAKLAAVNTAILTQTADTGQINWTTVTKPTATSTAAGYEIWKFTDSIGTFYFKFEYGTGGSAATRFGMWITVGTGSNGSGTITGIIGTRRQAIANANFLSTITNYTSHMCVIDGLFWFILAENCSGTNTNGATSFQCQGIFSFMRTCDSSGAIDGTGFYMFSNQNDTGNWNAIAYCIAQSTLRFDQAGFTPLPSSFFTFGLANQSSGTPLLGTDFGTGGNHDYQVMRHYAPMTPEIKAFPYCVSYFVGDAPVATTASFAAIGSTSHTFLFTGNCIPGSARSGYSDGQSQDAYYSLALVYE